ncbi:MAG: hypothetical protein AB8B55_05525 [Mariniblastus sp.]
MPKRSKGKKSNGPGTGHRFVHLLLEFRLYMPWDWLTKAYQFGSDKVALVLFLEILLARRILSA